jgi:L-ribulokinase
MRTGIAGAALIAVAVIDGHVVLPAVGAIEDGTFVGSLGTSAAYLYQGSTFRPLPSGAEGVARDAAVPGFWTYEAGQASFGDTLAWFASTVPVGETLEESLAVHEGAAASLAPGESGLMALDWWNGNRVPFADAQLSGLVLGFRADVPPAAIYRALMEGLCFGTRRILDTFRDNGFPVGRVVMTSGVATRSPLLVQLMADVMSTPIEVPRIDNATAVGAAIHGAVAAGVVTDFTEGAARFGAREAQTFAPDVSASRIYADLYTQYCALADDPALRTAMRAIAGIKAALQKDVRT